MATIDALTLPRIPATPERTWRTTSDPSSLHQLGDPPPPTRAARDEVYERIARRIRRNLPPERGCADGARRDTRLRCEQTIDAIEAELSARATAPSVTCRPTPPQSWPRPHDNCPRSAARCSRPSPRSLRCSPSAAGMSSRATRTRRPCQRSRQQHATCRSAQGSRARPPPTRRGAFRRRCAMATQRTRRVAAAIRAISRRGSNSEARCFRFKYTPQIKAATDVACRRYSRHRLQLHDAATRCASR